jgi:cystathionine beta-lyase/cystathionine gamma-synthase
VTEYFSENEIDVVVIDDRDENDLPAFLEKLVEYNRSIPRQKISFVVVFCSRSFRLPPNLTERLNDDGINLFGLHELTSVLTGPAIHSPSPAMVVLYSRGVQTKRLAEYMMRMRRYGGNIDLLTETYLSLLIGCPIENTRDDNPLPGYHELIDGESLGRRVEELRSNYRRLLDDFDAACPSRPLFAELLQTLRQRVTQHLLFLDGRVGTNPLNDTTQQQLRNILVEYRTIVKYSIYMRWYEIRQRNGSDAMRAVLKTGLEQRLLEYTSPCLDAGGKQLPRSVLLFSSGMAVCKSLLHFLAGEDRRVQRKLIVANTMYYEIERVLRMLRYEELPCDPVLESQAIIGAVASGAYKAIFMDPIANMVQLEGSSEKRLHANSRNLPALDIALIIDGLCRMQFDRPFYVVIDNSMFGVCFQIADYLNNRSVPRNLYFIVCGSIQKLYEKGLEVSGGGWLMVVSSDPEGHSNVMERLRLQCGGGELPLFNLVALEAVLGTKGCQEERTIRIMKNAEQLARHVQESLSFAGFDVGVFHPALVTHPDHAAWIASGRTGLPFFMLNLGKLFNDRLIVAVNDRMKKCGLSGFEARESYGFDRLTYCYYNPGTQEEAVRVSLAPYITEEMSSIKRIFSEAIDAIAPEIKRLETTGIHSPGECCS